jgi:hypothetical protein
MRKPRLFVHCHKAQVKVVRLDGATIPTLVGIEVLSDDESVAAAFQATVEWKVVQAGSRRTSLVRWTDRPTRVPLCTGGQQTREERPVPS